MKRIIIALLLAIAYCTWLSAQKGTITISSDTIGKATIKVTKTEADGTDTTFVSHFADEADSSNTTSHTRHQGGAYFDSKDFPFNSKDFPFNMSNDAVNGGIFVAVIAVVLIFGFPILVVFLAFYFRYKNRKAKYKLVEQALAAGQSIPEGVFNGYASIDTRAKGIKNTFTGIGLFIFLWALTDSFGIGCIGLLIMFMGIGQWVVALDSQQTSKNTLPRRNTEDSKATEVEPADEDK